VVFLVLLSFGYHNIDERVSIQLFPGKYEYENISVLWVFLFSFLAGMGVSLLIAIVNQFSLHIKLRKQRKDIQRLEKELRDLRNLPIKGEILEERVDTPELEEKSEQ
jgi:uncharacterized membrane protein YciS (DUF1049 family)